jgi:hypothetical protein
MDRFGKRRRAPEALPAKTFALGNNNGRCKSRDEFRQFQTDHLRGTTGSFPRALRKALLDKKRLEYKPPLRGETRARRLKLQFPSCVRMN